MEFKDYYKTLGIDKNATAGELKKAFRRLARKYHPDVNPGDETAERRFKEVNEAHEVLGDSETRRKYDDLGSNWKASETTQAPGKNPFAGGGGPFAGGPRAVSEDDLRSSIGADPFSDFFETFFRGSSGPAGGRRSTARRRGRDIEHELLLPLEHAYAGVTQRLTLTAAGRNRRIDVRIPPGVGEGSRVRVAAEGQPGSNGASAGDLFLCIKVAPHPVFERKGRDLYMEVNIPLTTAILGGEIAITVISRKHVRLKIPTTTQQGQIFRLQGHGMPSIRKSSTPGHLYVTANVQLPKELTDKARKHFEALAALEVASKSRRSRTSRKKTSDSSV